MGTEQGGRMELGCLKEGLLVTIIMPPSFVFNAKIIESGFFCSNVLLFFPTSDTAAARGGGLAVWRALGSLCRVLFVSLRDSVSSLCLAPALLHLKTPPCSWVFLPHSQSAQAKPGFGSCSEGSGSPALPGRAGSSSLLSMQMLLGGGGGSEPARHCLGTSCQGQRIQTEVSIMCLI